MEQITVDLCVPLTGPEGESVASVTLRRIQGREVIAAKRGGGAKADVELAQLAAMTGLTRSLLEDIDCADYLALQQGYVRLKGVRAAAGLDLKERQADIQIPLWRPVAVAGMRVSELVMRRPKVRDLVTAQKGALNEADAELWRYTNLCEQPPEVIEGLDFADYAALDEAFGRFLSSRERLLTAR